MASIPQERRLSVSHPAASPVDEKVVYQLSENIIQNKTKWMVALDGSEQSFEALNHAVKLMNKHDDHLILLHVCLTKPSALSRMTLTAEQIEEARRQTIAQGEDIMWKAERIARDEKVNTITSQNREAEDVKEEIIRECTQLEVNYLVMGSRGMGNLLNKILLGSTTEYCVKFSPVPVMIVKKNTPDAMGSRRGSVDVTAQIQTETVAPQQ
ncbi:hypothetical protein PROFUN_04394 [Planoprotostelium fungivorum]|uniref:UspA domain-containing protein n=1 Tax=Planoprotostelium fungivorum TaxID=1890364 RepID=A0A2P6NHT6_9EUKA|nr:hypothetical protein PROFUN_04394 [Planoprotostelium fungivorum]